MADDCRNNNSKKTKVLLVCGVLFLAMVSAGWTFSEQVLDNHECFVAVTSREMLQSGNWVMPTFNGQPRLEKTPLSYWLVAIIAEVTGKVDEFATRLPSVAFAVLSVCAIIYFVAQWLSLRTALLSAGVWATSLGYVRYAHSARPEMALTFFVTLCFLSFYSAITAQSRRRQIAYMVVFWVSFGLGNLAKGPAPIPLVMVPLFFYLMIFRQWKKLPQLLPIIGVLIFLAIMLPWPLVIAYRVNWDLVVWKQQFVDRFFGEYAPGNKPLYYYLPEMFMFVTPWVVFLPMALAAPFYRVWNRKQPVMQYLWVCFVGGLAILTLCGGKRQHYIIPFMPVMAVLIGILIEDMVFIGRAYSRRFSRTVLAGHVIGIIALAAAGCVYLIKIYPNMVTETFILGTVTVILATAVVVLFAAGKPAIACGTLFGGIVVLVMIGYTAFLNPLDYDRYARDFSRRLAQIVPRSDNLIAYEYISEKSVHYFGRVIPRIMDKSVLYERYEQGDWVVATAEHLEKLQKDGRLKMVYYKQKAARVGQQDAPGALFHKSTSFVAKES